jgi:hypothetical protein
MFKKVDFQKKLSLPEIEDLVARLYLVTHDSPYSIKDLASSDHRDEALKRLFVGVMEERFATEGVVGVARKFGFVREPSLVERRVFRTVLPILLLQLPKLRPARMIEIPDALMRKIEEEGFDATWPSLKEIYGDRLISDEVAYTARTIYSKVSLIVFLYLAYQAHEDRKRFMAEKEAEADPVADAQIKTLHELNEQLQKNLSQPHDKKSEVFEEWKKAYREKHEGAEPDPKSVDYKTVHKLVFGS